MKCIVLAAGYATRLYPLTENFPKPLLEVKGKSILDWLLEDVQSTNMVDEVIVVSNHKFYDIFTEWADKAKNRLSGMKLTILDDGSTDNYERASHTRAISAYSQSTGTETSERGSSTTGSLFMELQRLDAPQPSGAG